MRVTLDIDKQTDGILIFIKNLRYWLNAEVFKTKKGYHVLINVPNTFDEYALRKLWGDDPMRIKYKHRTLWQEKIIKDNKGKVIYESKEKLI